jgi:thioredoxin reductase (NADPH)
MMEPSTIRLSDGTTVTTRAVIMAMGRSPRKLEVPGYEKLFGSGVSVCATCDGAFFRNVPVAVVGGGNSAVEEGIFLTRYRLGGQIDPPSRPLHGAEDPDRRVPPQPEGSTDLEHNGRGDLR